MTPRPGNSCSPRGSWAGDVPHLLYMATVRDPFSFRLNRGQKQVRLSLVIAVRMVGRPGTGAPGFVTWACHLGFCGTVHAYGQSWWLCSHVPNPTLSSSCHIGLQPPGQHLKLAGPSLLGAVCTDRNFCRVLEVDLCPDAELVLLFTAYSVPACYTAYNCSSLLVTTCSL